MGLGYVEAAEPVTRDSLAAAAWEIEIACEKFAARPSLRPLYDPKGERIKL